MSHVNIAAKFNYFRLFLSRSAMHSWANKQRKMQILYNCFYINNCTYSIIIVLIHTHTHQLILINFHELRYYNLFLRICTVLEKLHSLRLRGLFKRHSRVSYAKSRARKWIHVILTHKFDIPAGIFNTRVLRGAFYRTFRLSCWKNYFYSCN